MTAPDRIQITHAQPMITPPAALTSDDIPPGPLSEDDLRQRWNQQADEYNQWESLDSCEQLAWAQALAIRADRHAAALKATPEERRPTDEDLYDLAAEFNGDPVPAMRRALELWGNPLQGAPATGESPAARPLLERVAQLGDVIGRQTVAQVQQLANQAAAWLRENPPGQPVAIDPRACPTPGACSCVEPTPPAPEAEFDDQQREAVHQAVAEALGSGAYDCTRVWSAWSCGTMGSDDFVPVAEDSDRVAEIADAAIEAIRAIPAPAPEPVTECPNCGYERGIAPAPQAGEVEA